jgi:hypothetical protein
VNILANRIVTLEEQQSYIPIYPPPYDPLWFLQLAPTLYGSQIELPADPIPFSFTNNAQPSHAGKKNTFVSKTQVLFRYV